MDEPLADEEARERAEADEEFVDADVPRPMPRVARVIDRAEERKPAPESQDRDARRRHRVTRESPEQQQLQRRKDLDRHQRPGPIQPVPQPAHAKSAHALHQRMKEQRQSGQHGRNALFRADRRIERQDGTLHEHGRENEDPAGPEVLRRDRRRARRALLGVLVRRRLVVRPLPVDQQGQQDHSADEHGQPAQGDRPQPVERSGSQQAETEAAAPCERIDRRRARESARRRLTAHEGLERIEERGGERAQERHGGKDRPEPLRRQGERAQQDAADRAGDQNRQRVPARKEAAGNQAGGHVRHVEDAAEPRDLAERHAPLARAVTHGEEHQRQQPVHQRRADVNAQRGLQSNFNRIRKSAFAPSAALRAAADKPAIGDQRGGVLPGAARPRRSSSVPSNR